MFESLLFRPNFPTAPQRSFDFFTFPNDLITDNRNYYTEIQFYEYDAGSLADIASGALAGALLGGPAGLGIGAGFGAADTIQNGFRGQGTQGKSLGMMKLPIPQRINDTVAFSWGEGSLKDVATSLLQQLSFQSNALYTAQVIAGSVVRGAEVLSGYALNPLFYQAFQHQNFREFQFQWVLAPRTRTESATIASMISLLKRASTPAKALSGFALKYPAVAMIKFFPNNLTGHPSDQIGGVILKPCIIQAISIDHIPVAGPAFFRGPEGAPVVVGITISVKELQLWYREDYMPKQSSIQNEQLPNTPERYTSQSGATNPERAG